MKLCECGCGEPAPIAKRSWEPRGWVKGQPLRFVKNHSSRVISAETRAKMSASGKSRPKSATHRAKIAAALRGRPKTVEHRKKLALARLKADRKLDTHGYVIVYRPGPSDGPEEDKLVA